MAVDKKTIVGIGALAGFTVSIIVDMCKLAGMDGERAKYLEETLYEILGLVSTENMQLYVLSFVLSKVVAHLTKNLTQSPKSILIAENLTLFFVNKKGRIEKNDVLEAGAFTAGKELGKLAEKGMQQVVVSAITQFSKINGGRLN